MTTASDSSWRNQRAVLLKRSAVSQRAIDHAGRRLDSKDPGQIDMPKLFQLCKHVLGMSKCVMILRPVVLPPLKDVAAHMHASGIVDGTTISVFDQISQRATGSVLMSGFVPMLLGIADLRAAVDAGDATAVRQEAAKFGNVMLGEVHEEGVTYELLCQLEVYKWLRPAIELCVEVCVDCCSTSVYCQLTAVVALVLTVYRLL